MYPSGNAEKRWKRATQEHSGTEVLTQGANSP